MTIYSIFGALNDNFHSIERQETPRCIKKFHSLNMRHLQFVKAKCVESNDLSRKRDR